MGWLLVAVSRYHEIQISVMSKVLGYYLESQCTAGEDASISGLPAKQQLPLNTEHHVHFMSYMGFVDDGPSLSQKVHVTLPCFVLASSKTL